MTLFRALLCALTGGHQWTPSKWNVEGVWTEKVCLDCFKTERNHQLPTQPLPGPRA